MAFQKLDSQWFTNKRKEANKAVSSTFYLTKAQYEKRNTNFENLFEPAAEVQPMENYEVEYYAGGKIANLVHKTTKAPVLHSILNKGEADQEDITIALGFYRKKGSDSFSAFY